MAKRKPTEGDMGETELVSASVAIDRLRDDEVATAEDRERAETAYRASILDMANDREINPEAFAAACRELGKTSATVARDVAAEVELVRLWALVDSIPTRDREYVELHEEFMAVTAETQRLHLERQTIVQAARAAKDEALAKLNQSIAGRSELARRGLWPRSE